MTRLVALALAALALTAAAPAPRPLPDFRFRPAAATLPDGSSETFPQRPGVEAVEANCTACHSAAMILNQPPLTRDEWTAEIAKMRNVYKAPIEDAALPDLMLYLAGPPPKQP